ncbi:dirigent protein 21-like [Malania oleifera]|uniref:dirigent protein 21-like n=1 Tax=Malania oleifera TaxID=397392 RepID=UPI0025AE6DEC|nr:dirigent protein 21-like [Malania oleifera]
MEKAALVALTLLLSLAMAAMPFVHSTSINYEQKEANAWASKLQHAKPKASVLHFYFHEIFSGKNPTAVRVAQSPITDKSVTSFGLINIFDNPLTVGPDPSSKLIGRAQGLDGSAGLDQVDVLMTMNLFFTDGKYNGSTLAVVGRNAIMTPLREMSIVGGTGVFRFARGFATAKTYYLNLTTGVAVVEYNVMVLHY